MFGEIGRVLMGLGLALFLVGVLLTFAGRIPGLGQLPGDLTVARGNLRLYAPFGTMIVLSIVLSLLLNLITRFFR
ncbi:MAG: DUF2905 domain-containing protein [Caldilineaceae bacterium]|nr:DUF2905 domain-containing protein [Caldilineaceae bacterium]